MEPEQVKSLTDEELYHLLLISIFHIVRANEITALADPLYSAIEDELNRRSSPRPLA